MAEMVRRLRQLGRLYRNPLQLSHRPQGRIRKTQLNPKRGPFLGSWFTEGWSSHGAPRFSPLLRSDLRVRHIKLKAASPPARPSATRSSGLSTPVCPSLFPAISREPELPRHGVCMPLPPSLAE